MAHGLIEKVSEVAEKRILFFHWKRENPIEKPGNVAFVFFSYDLRAVAQDE